MLEYLRLQDTGPAAELEMHLASRLNLIAGDNGLGKSFLLDVAWWALSGYWLSALNPKLNRGYPARPQGWRRAATIEFGYGHGGVRPQHGEGVCTGGEWTRQSSDLPTSDMGLVIYAQVDGAFAVWDPYRHGGEPGVRGRDRPLAFTAAEVWNGLHVRRSTGEEVTVCNGLISDWSRWIADGGENARRMERLLSDLSPTRADAERLGVGKPERLSSEDARYVPTIHTRYGNSVPVLHASAAVRRVCTLAYMLTWAWSEHRLGAWGPTEPGETTRVVLLFDEVEGHLHPQWQRTMLPGVIRALESFYVRAQIIAATHSPLVLASVEPHFGDEDRLFHLDFADGQVRLDEMPWVKQGDAVNWLVSDMFGLKEARSVEAERAIGAAQALMRGETELPAGLDSAELIDAELRRVLASHDAFWPRWVVWSERNETR